MSITDELREYVRHYSVVGSRKDKTLVAIADRIDATYEEDVNTACKLANSLSADELDERGWIIATDENMAEHGWVRLPLDADGVPIHAGEMLDGYGKTIEVVEIRHGRSGWVIISRDGNGYADTFAFTHYKPPTVENILLEFVDRWCTRPDIGDDDIIAEYAAKLRLAGE